LHKIEVILFLTHCILNYIILYSNKGRWLNTASKPIYSVQQSPSWEANRSLNSQGITRIL
jgi:hypothetical protein